MPIRYTAVTGDCLATIARKNGFSDWRKIYDHPDNAGLRAIRPNPNVIEPGDVIVIPDKTPKTATVSTGARHTFVVSQAPVSICLELRKFDGKPMRGVKYKLEVADLVVEKTTGSDGRIELGFHSVCTTGTLTVWLPGRGALQIFDLKLGDLDTVAGEKGIRQRLNNLGYQCGEGDTLDAAARLAIRAFQCEEGSTIDGRISDQLRNGLRKRHGS